MREKKKKNIQLIFYAPTSPPTFSVRIVSTEKQKCRIEALNATILEVLPHLANICHFSSLTAVNCSALN